MRDRVEPPGAGVGLVEIGGQGGAGEDDGPGDGLLCDDRWEAEEVATDPHRAGERSDTDRGGCVSACPAPGSGDVASEAATPL